jgi:hypothetical protein
MYVPFSTIIQLSCIPLNVLINTHGVMHIPGWESMHLGKKIVCNEEKTVKVHHSSVIMSNAKWVFIVSCDTAYMWLVIYGKSEYGSK